MSTETKQNEGSAVVPETRVPDFWHCDRDADHLIANDIGEAVENWADEMYPAPLPETVEVFGFAQTPLRRAWVGGLVDRALESIYEALDEEYGNPEESTTPTPGAVAAARALADALSAEYRVWTCDLVTSETVRVADFVPPDWMHARGPDAPPEAA